MKSIIPHPITIKKYLSKYSLLFFIPAAKGLLGFYKAGNLSQTVTLSIIVSLLWIGVSAARLRAFRLEIREGFLTCREGVFFTRKRRIPLSKITCVLAKRTLLTAPLKSAEIRIETESGGRSGADFTCVLRDGDLRALTELIFENSTKNPPLRFGASGVIIYALTASAAGGILAAAPVIDKAAQILGEGIAIRLYGTVSRAGLLFAGILPEAGGFLAALLMAGYLISALISAVKHARFRIEEGGNIRIKSGLLTSYTTYIRRGGIASVAASQGILPGLLRRRTVTISVAGYGKPRPETPLLIPPSISREIPGITAKILPGFSLPPHKIPSDKNSLPRFILLPVTALIITIISTVFLWRSTKFFSGLYMLIGMGLAVFWLILTIIEFNCHKKGGISLSPVICGTGRRGFKLITRELAPQKLGLLTIHESPFDRKRGHVNLIIRENSENLHSLKIRYVNKNDFLNHGKW